MTTTVSEYDFVNWFRTSETRRDQFSREALFALYSYLIELEESTDQTIEFGPIALCVEFTEYKTADEAASNYFDYEGMTYGDDGEELETADEVEAKALEYLQDKATVIEFDGGIIIEDF